MFSARKQTLRVPSAFVSKACSSSTRVVKLHCRKKSVRGWKIESFWLFFNTFFKMYLLPTTLKSLRKIICRYAALLASILLWKFSLFLPLLLSWSTTFSIGALPSAIQYTETSFLPSEQLICSLYCLDSFDVSVHRGRQVNLLGGGDVRTTTWCW